MSSPACKKRFRISRVENLQRLPAVVNSCRGQWQWRVLQSGTGLGPSPYRCPLPRRGRRRLAQTYHFRFAIVQSPSRYRPRTKSCGLAEQIRATCFEFPFTRGLAWESPQPNPGAGRYNFRKLARSCLPDSVSTDSGWNCTPSTFISRWRSPMMSPSGDEAEISRHAGRVSRSTISEW